MVERARRLSFTAKWTILGGLCLAAIIATAFLRPIPQPLAYHNFADQRTLAGIPRALDVLSNLAFLLSGALGLFFVLRARGANLEAAKPTTGRAAHERAEEYIPEKALLERGGAERQKNLDAGTRWAFGMLFFGLALTSAGSAYYHLAPDNERLVFDRLPMIIAMAGCTGALLADRFGGRTAWSMAALIAIGLWSVQHWSAGEQTGHGDLRWYLLYQVMTMVVGAMLLFFFPSRNGATLAFVIAVAGNLAAKVFEFLDQPIFALGSVVSGHTLKHLSAGLAFLPLALLMRRIGQRERMEAGVGR